MSADIIFLPANDDRVDVRDCAELRILVTIVEVLGAQLMEKADKICGPGVPRAEAQARLKCLHHALANVEADVVALIRAPS